jgi:endoglucanase
MNQLRAALLIILLVYPLSAHAAFYNFPNTSVDVWIAANPTDTRMPLIRDQIASFPAALWIGNSGTQNGISISQNLIAAQSAGEMPVIVLYNIPGRDCGGFSSGGAGSTAAYETWVDGVVSQIGTKPVTVIVEPDALAFSVSGCQIDRTALNYAVTHLKTNDNSKVYIDAGNAEWPTDISGMATALGDSNIAAADGFSLNVSNFYTTAETTVRGNAISALVSNKHYVIDTSRNGNGSNGEWCNPCGRALGAHATTNTGYQLVDALLWIKTAGESDGTCNNNPPAGVFSPDLAYALARNQQGICRARIF